MTGDAIEKIPLREPASDVQNQEKGIGVRDTHQTYADAIAGRAQQGEDGKGCAGDGRNSHPPGSGGGTNGTASAADALDPSARVLMFHESCRHG
jgi:hypothetical protein